MPAHPDIPQIPGPTSRPKDRVARKRAVKKTAARTEQTQQITIVDPEAKYAPTTWGAGSGSEYEDLVVPSGQLCQVRRPGLQGLMEAGVLHDVDSLSAIVDKKHIKRAKGEKTEEVDVRSLIKDDASLANILHVADRITCFIVVQPQIVMTPNDPTNREPGVIYADMIDMMDKMFLVNYAVGGTRDLERFRGEFDQSVRGVDIIKDMASSPK